MNLLTIASHLKPGGRVVVADYVAEAELMGDDLAALTHLCPPIVIDALRRKKLERHPALERLRVDKEE